ncbi:MAG TPA: GNAT family N-acetyltransferase [Longimicrobiales bacterium]|nr:GNAT family N-acetyltransferase [Longimicrobiales bacterium]
MSDDPKPLDRPKILIALCDPDTPEARWCLDRYYEELGELFEEGFDVALSTVSDTAPYRAPRGAFLVARHEGRAAGCGALTLTGPQVGYIKRMWIDRSIRGLGLGRRMLEALESTARSMGCLVAELETNRALSAAIRLYRTAGYEEVPPFNDEHYAHHWFRKTLAEDGADVGGDDAGRPAPPAPEEVT